MAMMGTVNALSHGNEILASAIGQRAISARPLDGSPTNHSGNEYATAGSRCALRHTQIGKTPTPGRVLRCVSERSALGIGTPVPFPGSERCIRARSPAAVLV